MSLASGRDDGEAADGLTFLCPRRHFASGKASGMRGTVVFVALAIATAGCVQVGQIALWLDIFANSLGILQGLQWIRIQLLGAAAGDDTFDWAANELSIQGEIDSTAPVVFRLQGIPAADYPYLDIRIGNVSVGSTQETSGVSLTSHTIRINDPPPLNETAVKVRVILNLSQDPATGLIIGNPSVALQEHVPLGTAVATETARRAPGGSITIGLGMMAAAILLSRRLRD